MHNVSEVPSLVSVLLEDTALSLVREFSLVHEHARIFFLFSLWGVLRSAIWRTGPPVLGGWRIWQAGSETDSATQTQGAHQRAEGRHLRHM